VGEWKDKRGWGQVIVLESMCAGLAHWAGLQDFLDGGQLSSVVYEPVRSASGAEELKLITEAFRVMEGSGRVHQQQTCSLLACISLPDLTGCQTTDESGPALDESCGSLSSSLWRIVESCSYRISGSPTLAARPAHIIFRTMTWPQPGLSFLSPTSVNSLIKFIYSISPSVFPLISFAFLWSSLLVMCHWWSAMSVTLSCNRRLFEVKNSWLVLTLLITMWPVWHVVFFLWGFLPVDAM
jgi:hypothetical protein